MGRTAERLAQGILYHRMETLDQAMNDDAG
jgi:hypothetical protein